MTAELTMSKEQEELFERLERRFGTLLKLGQALVAGAFAIGVWAAVMQSKISSLSKRGDKTDEILGAQVELLRQIDKRLAVREADQFTSRDWTTASRAWAENMNAIDKRVTRNEDALIRIDGRLKEILDLVGR